MTLSKITPLEAKRLVDDGGVLVDIRGTAEHARERIPGARNLPLGSGIKVEASAPVVFHCRSGGRTSANAATLAQAANSEAYILDGGLDAWKRAGLPVVVDRSQSIDIMRQVQIADRQPRAPWRSSRLFRAPRILSFVRIDWRRARLCRPQRLVRHGQAS